MSIFSSKWNIEEYGCPGDMSDLGWVSEWGGPRSPGQHMDDKCKDGFGTGEGIHESEARDELIVTDGYTGRAVAGGWYGGNANQGKGNGDGAGELLPCSDPDMDKKIDEIRRRKYNVL